MVERIQLTSDASKHVQAYLDYVNIVGNADGGKMMSEQQFEEYKMQIREARKNRLYVSWRNIKGVDCRMIGPASKCFCGHRYKDHAFDNVKDRRVFCRQKKCRCPLYSLIPVFGAQDFKCLCKHSHLEHDQVTKKCTRPRCACHHFSSKHSCSCSLFYTDHETVFQSREEREAQGRPVDPKWMEQGTMIAGYGGLGSHMALVDDADQQQMLKDTKKAIAGKKGAPALGYDEAPPSKALAKLKSGGSGTGEKTPYELFNTPHKYGDVGKQIEHLSKGIADFKF